jgi:uroporphyrinogen decarboxylase
MQDYGVVMTKEQEAKVDDIVAKIRNRVSKEAMTPRQRIDAVANGETPDRIPIWANGTGLHVPATYGVDHGALYQDPVLALLAYLHHVERFQYDTLSMFRFSLGDEEFGGVTTMTDFGVPFTEEGYVKTSCDIDGIKFANPNKDGSLAWTMWMISTLKEKLGDIMPIWGFITPPGLSAVCPGSREYGEAMMDMITNPNLAHSLTALALKWEIMFGKAQLAAGADLVHMVDAAGMCSPDQFREFSFPYMRGLVAALDNKVMWCCADDVSHVIEYYAKAGIKYFYLNSEMPLEKAKEVCNEYGITLRYGLSKEILIDGPKERIREEVKRIVKTGWEGGHFILGTEALDTDTPAENIDAYIEAAREYCQLPLNL